MRKRDPAGPIGGAVRGLSHTPNVNCPAAPNPDWLVPCAVAAFALHSLALHRPGEEPVPRGSVVALSPDLDVLGGGREVK